MTKTGVKTKTLNPATSLNTQSDDSLMSYKVLYRAVVRMTANVTNSNWDNVSDVLNIFVDSEVFRTFPISLTMAVHD